VPDKKELLSHLNQAAQKVGQHISNANDIHAKDKPSIQSIVNTLKRYIENAIGNPSESLTPSEHRELCKKVQRAVTEATQQIERTAGHRSRGKNQVRTALKDSLQEAQRTFKPEPSPQKKEPILPVEADGKIKKLRESIEKIKAEGWEEKYGDLKDEELSRLSTTVQELEARTKEVKHALNATLSSLKELRNINKWSNELYSKSVQLNKDLTEMGSLLKEAKAVLANKTQEHTQIHSKIAELLELEAELGDLEVASDSLL
jgi:hypothetical protein